MKNEASKNHLTFERDSSINRLSSAVKVVDILD